MFVNLGDRVIAEKSIFPNKAGSTKENYFLLGLEFKIEVRATNANSVILYASDEPENEDNDFLMETTQDGLWFLTCVAGQDFTSLNVCKNQDSNFADGVKFYFRIKVLGSQTQIFDRIFWVREYSDLILFTSAKIPYVSPFPVLVDNLIVPCTIGDYAKNQAGSLKYDGIETVQVFNTVSAPSSGSFVIESSELNVNELEEIELVDRDSAGGIPGFIPPPGCPDFSRYFAFVTFRMRAKRQSQTYRDIDVILFPAKTCAIEESPLEDGGSNYGWDSDGSNTVPKPVLPTQITILVPPTTTVPPPVCSSSVTLLFNGTVNQYSPQITSRVYSSQSGGTLLATSYNATPVASDALRISRTSFGGDVSQPISGWIEVSESSPNRTTTNRVEVIVHGCAVTPVEIIMITPGLVTTTPGSRSLTPSKTYTLKRYSSKYGATQIEEIPAVYSNSHQLVFVLEEEKSGWWSITEDGIEISGARFEATISPSVPELIIYVSLGNGTYKYNEEDEIWELISSLPTNSSYIWGNAADNFYFATSTSFKKWDGENLLNKFTPDLIGRKITAIYGDENYVYASCRASSASYEGGIYKYTSETDSWDLMYTGESYWDRFQSIWAYNGNLVVTEDYYYVSPGHPNNTPGNLYFFNGTSWTKTAAGQFDRLLFCGGYQNSSYAACGFDNNSGNAVVYTSVNGTSWTRLVDSKFIFSDFLGLSEIVCFGTEWVAIGTASHFGLLLLVALFSNGGGTPTLSVIESGGLYYTPDSIWGTSVSDLWVVSLDSSTQARRIFHYDGASWNQETSVIVGYSTSVKIFGVQT